MNSYQRRKQEISYLRERIAKLEALLHPAEIRQIDQDILNKFYTDRLRKLCEDGMWNRAVENITTKDVKPL